MIVPMMLLALAAQSGAPSRLNFGAPSVSAEAYPKLVDCTLSKQRDAIGRLIDARDAFTRKWLETPAAERAALGQVEAAPVVLANGRAVPANRLEVQIIEACHPLQEGKPLGFGMARLYGDWRSALKVRN